MELMKAYYLHGREDIRPRDVARPEPGSGEVLVEVHRVGLCGSDLDYYAYGQCGSFRPSSPFVLGHELAGRVVDLGADVTEVAPGQRVAVHPARPCGSCRYCRQGRSNLCTRMHYLGTASVSPHIDGGLREYLVVPQASCYPVPDRVSDAEAALLEPLSVALHAVRRAGSLVGFRVLVTGGGTIGQLAAMVARRSGAASVAISEPQPQRRQWANHFGVREVYDPARETPASGSFDVVIEASGAPAALGLAIEAVRPGGTVVQVGTQPGSVEFPANLVMTKELQLMGSFRFTTEYATALELVVEGSLPVASIVTRTFAFSDTPEAFTAALDPTHLKVQVESDRATDGSRA